MIASIVTCFAYLETYLIMVHATSIPEGIDAKGIVEALNKRANNIVAVRGNCDAEVDQMLLDFPYDVRLFDVG